MKQGFIGLVQNENMKIYRRPRTWILTGILAVVVSVVAIVMEQVSPTPIDANWAALAEQQIQENEATLANIDNVPAPFRAVTREAIENQNSLLSYHLHNNINPYEQNSWSFVTGAALEIVPLVVVFVIIMASTAVASDFTTGSIKMLLIRPHQRYSILLSKYVAMLLYTFVMLVVLFFTAWLAGNFVFGYGSFTDLSIFVKDGQIVSEIASGHVLKILGLEFISTTVLMTMAFMLAILFRNYAFAIGIGVLIGWMVSLDMIFAPFEWTKYLLITNLDLTYYLMNAEGKITGTTLTFSLIVAAIYWAVFMIVSWSFFQKRDITV